jgi:cell shape-determining protein MreD
MLWLGFINAIWLLAIVIIQLSWLDQLPSTWPKLNLLLVVLVVWLILKGWRRVSFWILGLGIFLDCLAVYPFGSQTLLWLITMGLTNILLVNFFTNKSLSAFSGLIIIATILHWVGLAILSHDWLISGWWLRLAGQIIINWLLILLLYYLIYWIDKRLSPLFLWKSR